MASHGIRDKVAIVGMGCTPFGEHWDRSTDDMLIQSSSEALTSAGVKLDDVDAFWLGTMGSGLSGLTLSRPLKIDHKPVTHVENFCATGSEAFRNACYAVASGAYALSFLPWRRRRPASVSEQLERGWHRDEYDQDQDKHPAHPATAAAPRPASHKQSPFRE